MKKYIAPEMNVTKFDVEDVITTSTTAPDYVYGEPGDENVRAVTFTEIFGN